MADISTILVPGNNVNMGALREHIAHGGNFTQSGDGAVARTGEEEWRDTVKVTQFGTTGDGVADDTAEINAALAKQDTSSVGSFEVQVPAGNYLVTDTGAAILDVQNGTCLRGTGSLEGVQVKVGAASTATSALKDAGSAAKTEIYNLTVNGQSNTNLLALFDFGTDGSIQLGTYGRFDNLMGRNAANATAFNVNTNIFVFGDLYSLTTRDGFVSVDGGSGAMVKTMCPYGFSRYGIKFGGIGDNLLQSECEAPTADAAIPWFANRDGVFGMGTMILSLQAGLVTETVFAYNPTYNLTGAGVSGIAVGPYRIIRADRTARFGDASGTSESGTSTGIGARTLTDSTQTWKRNQWKGGSVFITSGTGNGNWSQIASNTKDTITLTGDWPSTGGDVTPVTGDNYALDYACKATNATGTPTGAGHMSAPRGVTLPEAAILDLAAEDATFDSLVVGNSNDAGQLVNKASVLVAIDFASVAAHSPGTPSNVTVRGAVVSKTSVVVTPPQAVAEQGITFDAFCVSADTIRIVPKNGTAGAIDLANSTYRVSIEVWA